MGRKISPFSIKIVGISKYLAYNMKDKGDIYEHKSRGSKVCVEISISLEIQI